MIVGEVRSEECLDLLLALNAGLPGLATIHANSARAALVKMCTLPLRARLVVPGSGGYISASCAAASSSTYQPSPAVRTAAAGGSPSP
jgi:pilus assembly protein CpaF